MEEKELINKAKKRVAFKIHSAIYVLTCLLFWTFWFFIFKSSGDLKIPALKFCLFITLAWGICIVAHYLFVYKWGKKFIEKEINYLKRQTEKEQQKLEEESFKENNE